MKQLNTVRTTEQSSEIQYIQLIFTKLNGTYGLSDVTDDIYIFIYIHIYIYIMLIPIELNSKNSKELESV